MTFEGTKTFGRYKRNTKLISEATVVVTRYLISFDLLNAAPFKMVAFGFGQGCAVCEAICSSWESLTLRRGHSWMRGSVKNENAHWGRSVTSFLSVGKYQEVGYTE